ncbi:MAG: hypothetical protein JST50_01020 [Bacteroidetes bacterium]|jgi:hypothetical protein|nr:hypothetical protein [Bacteroidota bacterium]
MTNNHLTTFLESLKTDIIHSLQSNGKYATGQTAQQIVIDTDGDSPQLQLPAYMQILESGRSPTSPNAIPGSPPMIDRIKQWCQAKGIPDKAAWAIKKSIDKKGFKGTPGILSEPLSEANINLRLDQTIDPMTDEISQQIIDSLGLS